MQLLVEKPVSKYPVGAIVKETDFPEGRSEELQRMGVLSPIDGDLRIPVDTEDASAWKAHAEALREENKKLRTANPDASRMARILDLEQESKGLKATIKQANDTLAKLQMGTVQKTVYDNLNDRYAQLERLYASALEELKKHAKA